MFCFGVAEVPVTSGLGCTPALLLLMCLLCLDPLSLLVQRLETYFPYTQVLDFQKVKDSEGKVWFLNLGSCLVILFLRNGWFFLLQVED